MIPRLKESKKWSSLPKELLEQIEGIFAETFEKNLSNCKVIAQGRIYSKELLLRVGYIEAGRLKQNNFECSFPYSKSKDNVMNLVHAGIDSLGSMMQEHFSKKETDFPEDWTEFKVENKILFLKFSTENSDLEEQANKLLGLHEEGLVKGNDPKEDIDVAKKTMGIDED